MPVRWLPLLALLMPAATHAAPRPFAVVAHLATNDPDTTKKWLTRQLAEANRHFAGAGIAFEVVETRALPRSFTVVDNIRERIKLRRHFRPRVINIFVVDRVLDPHPSESTRRAARRVGREPSGELAGAHILSGARRVPRTFILASRSASSAVTLTHELGHFFWLPHHRDPGNIMSYGARRQTFDARQIGALEAMARIYRRRRVVRSVGRAGSRGTGSARRGE